MLYNLYKKVIFQHLETYTYLLSWQNLDEKTDVTLYGKYEATDWLA